jgi:hypothetical protein
MLAQPAQPQESCHRQSSVHQRSGTPLGKVQFPGYLLHAHGPSHLRIVELPAASKTDSGRIMTDFVKENDSWARHQRAQKRHQVSPPSLHIFTKESFNEPSARILSRANSTCRILAPRPCSPPQQPSIHTEQTQTHWQSPLADSQRAHKQHETRHRRKASPVERGSPRADAVARAWLGDTTSRDSGLLAVRHFDAPFAGACGVDVCHRTRHANINGSVSLVLAERHHP